MIKIIQAHFNFFLYIYQLKCQTKVIKIQKRNRVSTDYRGGDIKLKSVIESQIFGEFSFSLECLLMLLRSLLGRKILIKFSFLYGEIQ